MRRGGLAALAVVLCMALSGIAQQPQGNAQAAVERNLRQANAAFHAGYAALGAQRLEAARVDFGRVVRLAPTLPEGHAALGAVLVQMGRVEEAIPELKQALALRPGDAAMRGNLAAAYGAEARAAKTPAEAEAALENAVGADPTDGKLEDQLGAVLAQQKQWPQAEAAFRRALKRVPCGSDQTSRFPAGVTTKEQAQQQIPCGNDNKKQSGSGDAGPMALSGRIHMHLGVVLEAEQQQAEAEQELRLAARLAPENPEIAYQLGLLLAGEGRDEEALEPLKRAVSAETAAGSGSAGSVPTGADLALAMSLQRLGRQAEAIPYFERAVAAAPLDGSALNNLGLALTETGKAKQAIPYFQRALALRAGDPVFHEDLGVAYIQMSDFKTAIAEFEQAEKLDARNPELHYDLGLAYKLEDRMDDAVRELKAAATLDPRLPDPPYTLGILEMQMGQLPEAADALRTALALRPQNGEGWSTLGSVLNQLHQSAEAERALRRAMELLPAQPGPRITLAAVLAAEGRRDEAKALRHEAEDLTRVAVNRQRATFSMNAGNQLLERGQIADAVGRFQEAIAADPGFAEAHRQLAVALDRQGRAAEAAAERATAEKLDAAGKAAAQQ